MPDVFDGILVGLPGTLLNILLAIGILIIGWLIALALAAVVRWLLRRTTLDNRLAQVFAGDRTVQKIEIERWISTAVFWLVMLFVLVAFFNQLSLPVLAVPINTILTGILGSIPNLLKALLLGFVAWLVATLARLLIRRLFAMTNAENRLAQEAGVERPQGVPLSETISNVVYWFVLLLFLPGILGALNLTGLLQPVSQMVDEILAILPNLFGAVIILVVGWFVARVVRQIVTNLLVAAGADQLGARVGLGTTPDSPSLSSVAGTLVYILIFIPVLIAALNTLNIEAISQPAVAMLTTLLQAVPAVFGAAVILGLAYFLGRLIADLVSNLLNGLGFDQLMMRLGLSAVPVPEAREIPVGEDGPAVTTTTVRNRRPSEVAGFLVLVVIMFFAAIEAANLMGFEILAVILAQLLRYAGQILVAVIVFGIGLYLANLAHTVIRSTGGSQSSLLAQAARGGIIIFSGALALRQTGIAEDIVNLAFGLLLGAVAVAIALAFGLGGRQIAERWLVNRLQSLYVNRPDTPPEPPSANRP